MAVKKTSRLIWGFLAGVFLLKLVVVLQLKDHPLLQPDVGLDTTAYVELAQRVRNGDVALGPGLYFVSLQLGRIKDARTHVNAALALDAENVLAGQLTAVLRKLK